MCCEEPRPAWSGRNSTASRTTGITSAARALQNVFTLCSVTQRHNRETAKIQDGTRKLGHWPLKGGILLLPATSPNADRLTYFITRFSSKFARSYNKRSNHTSNMLLDCYIKHLTLVSIKEAKQLLTDKRPDFRNFLRKITKLVDILG